MTGRTAEETLGVTMSEDHAEVGERQKVSLAVLAEILAREISKSMGGRDASSLMPRIAIAALDGEPNWGARIGEVPLNVLSAYNEALGRVRALYDIDDDGHQKLRMGPKRQRNDEAEG